MEKTIRSVQFSHSVMSDSLRPHGPQHARPPCPSPSPRACSGSCPLSRWCHPAISSSVVLFSSRLQSFPASGFFPMSQFFISCGYEHPGLISFRMDWLDLLPVQRTLRSLLQHHSSKASILQHSAFFIVQPSHPHMTIGKTTASTLQGLRSCFFFMHTPIHLQGCCRRDSLEIDGVCESPIRDADPNLPRVYCLRHSGLQVLPPHSWSPFWHFVSELVGKQNNITPQLQSFQRFSAFTWETLYFLYFSGA